MLLTLLPQDKLGCMYKLLLHNPTGHYVLDLAEPLQRDVLVRLGEVNTEDREYLRIRCVVTSGSTGPTCGYQARADPFT